MLAVSTSVMYLHSVACLPLDPRFAGSNPAKNNGFLMVIKILLEG
jgi:hypothetical protein